MSLWTIKTPPTGSVAASLHILTGAKLSVQSLMFFQALLSLHICLKCKEKTTKNLQITHGKWCGKKVSVTLQVICGT